MRCVADARGGLSAADAYRVPVEVVMALFDTLSFQAARLNPPKTEAP